MMLSRLTVGAALIALVFAGCSSNSSAPTGLSQAKVGQVVQTNVTPVLNQVQSFLPPAKAGLQSGDLEKGECQTFQCEVSGTFQICPDGFTFTNCNNGDGEVSNGSVTSTFDGQSGSITFNLTIGASSLFGTIGVSDTGDCFAVTYSTFTATIPGASTSFDGIIEQCAGEAFPTGSLDVTVMDSGGNFLLEFLFDGTNIATIFATDLGNQDTLTCSANLQTGQATCN